MKNDNYVNIISFGLKSLVGGLFVAGGVCLSFFTSLSAFVPVTFYVIAGSFFSDGIKSLIKYFKNSKLKKNNVNDHIQETKGAENITLTEKTCSKEKLDTNEFINTNIEINKVNRANDTAQKNNTSNDNELIL